MEKREIRRRIRNLRTMLSAEERLSAAETVFARLEAEAAFLMADKILMYHSLPDELGTREFLDRWHSRKSFFLPRVNGVDLEILPYDKSRLELGAFHIEESTGCDVTPEEEIELIVVPAVAYDSAGNRLGRGKGFYDRLLQRTKAVTIGVAYDFQLVEEIPVEEHDVPVDMVITPSKVCRRKKRSR